MVAGKVQWMASGGVVQTDEKRDVELDRMKEKQSEVSLAFGKVSKVEQY